MSEPTASRGRSVLVHWVPSILFNVVLPIVTFQATVGAVGEVAALLLSGVWPMVETLGTLAIRRHVDEFGVFTLIFLGLSVVAALGFNTPRLLLAKEAAVTGLFGLVLLASLLAPRPLMFYFGRKFATDGTPEQVAWWNGLWQFPNFRATQRIITAVWGVAMTAESVLHIVLTYWVSVSLAVTIFNVLPLVVTGLLVAWTIWFGQRRAAAARARGAQGVLPPGEPVTEPA